MADLVGGSFLSATLQVLFDRLASRELLNLFWKPKKDGEKLLRKMKLTLFELNSVLDDAEKQHITKPAVKDWLDELKDALYDADDLLDEIATEALRLKSEADKVQVSTSSRTSTSSINHVFDSEMFSKIEEIVDRLEYFAKAKDVLGLKELGFGQKKVSAGPEVIRPSTFLVDESFVWGRKADKGKIIQLLLSQASGNEIDVIPIVGMGGLGKTTLAQLVYNDVRVGKHFDTKSWACVSHDFDICGVTKTILEAVSSNNYSDTKDLNTLQVKLKESLTGKKFLLVLDDVWNENPGNWDILRTPFKGAKCGSKIIVTTRNLGVASIMQTVPVHQLQQLSDEACWSLFANIAFHEGDFSARPDLEKIGKKIVIKRCKGLPLAAKTLAGLLRSKHDVEEWNDILKSDIWDLPQDKNNILPVLRLSYHYLPSCLKQCFAYCSIFPKDWQYKKENLVLLWKAQNFVQSKNNKTPEKIGNEYFHELLSRSFFQPLSNNKSSFVMHDLIHDLAQVVSGQFSYRLDGTKQQITSLKTRHFSYVRSHCDGYEKFEAINEVRCLRTFLPLEKTRHPRFYVKEMVLNDILPTKRCLRVLSLMHYKIEVLSNSFVNLIHLRYLDLSYTAIKQLPEWVCTLYNLQTLLLSHCRSLTTLPGEIVKLVHLRDLDIFGTNLSEMPSQMSRLKALKHLPVFTVGKLSGSSINELKEFDHLAGKLSISCLQNVRSGMDALEAKLKEKQHLEELLLEWGNDTSDTQNERDVLENLQPHTNLKSLVIINYGGTRFPNWLGHGSYTNIATVCLANCKYCLSLPPLGQLSSLKNLTISRMDGITEVGPEFYGDFSLTKPFQSLETLRFEELSEWVEWHPLGDGEFFQLRQLFVVKCPKLVGGLPKDIPCWVRVVIEECPQLKASVPKSCATSSGELVLKRCDGVELGWQDFSFLVKLKIFGMQNLKELAPELCSLTNLKELWIEDCPRLLSFPNTGLPPMLTELYIKNCEAMQLLSVFELSSAPGCSLLVSSAAGGVPPMLNNLELNNSCHDYYSSLKRLYLTNSCDTLKTLPLGLFRKLRFLDIVNCKYFESLSIPSSELVLQNLDRVRIDDCPNMVSFSGEGLHAPNLASLEVRNCKKLKELPERMHTLLPSLDSLKIANCPETESFPDGGLPPKLRNISILKCKKLVGSLGEWGLQRLLSLRSLRLTYGDEEVPFPEEGLLPSTTLTSLWISNIKSLNNGGLKLLSSLTGLIIDNCPRLQSLPEEGLPASLTYLKISGCPELRFLPESGLPASLSQLKIQKCPLLKASCQRNIGDDWHKIGHIPFIKIDDDVIF